MALRLGDFNILCMLPCRNDEPNLFFSFVKMKSGGFKAVDYENLDYT